MQRLAASHPLLISQGERGGGFNETAKTELNCSGTIHWVLLTERHGHVIGYRNMLKRDWVPQQSAGWHLLWSKNNRLLYSDTGDNCYQLNTTAATAWSLCDGIRTARAIGDQLVGLFHGEPDEIHADLDSALLDFQRLQAITPKLNETGGYREAADSDMGNLSAATLSAMFPDQRLSSASSIRQSQLVMIRMLKIFDRICTACEIEYFIMYGTLLGALRHQGFIPFDSDIDICMLEKDYRRFVEIGQALLPADLFLQNSVTDEFYSDPSLVKLRDRYSCYTQWASSFPEQKSHHGLQVDIFLMDQQGNKLVSPWIEVKLEISDIYPLTRLPFESFYPMCPRYPESVISRIYPDFKQMPPVEQQHPKEGTSSATTPCDHPMSLVYKSGN